VPHPLIKTGRARHVEIAANRALPLEVDGRALARASRATVNVKPGAIRILI
jgi:diacylglycerol kinase family enzyme